MTTNPALPNYTRPEVGTAADDLTLVHDLLGGTRRMHARSSSYIRKWSEEDQAVYDIRRQCETLFEGLGRTLSAATGMLFAKAPALEWNASETAMSPHWDNLDAAGTKGTVLVKRFSEAAIRDGLQIILVDHPSPPEGVTITAANEQALGLRPTWALYGRSQAINWRTAIVDNRRVLSLLVLAESGEATVGEFGVSSAQRYRELRLILTPAGYQATWRLWEQVDDKGDSLESFRIVGQGVFKNRAGQMANVLPVSVAYTGRTDAPMVATIPLLGVAWANLAHWRQSTALTFASEVSSYAQPVVCGAIAPDASGVPGKLRLGPLVLVHLSEADASFKWEAPPTEAFGQLEKNINEKLGQMAKLGMAFLTTDTRAAETAEAKRLDATAENSTLSTAAQGIEDAVNAALEHHAWYLGIAKPDAPVLTINRDYESTTMDAQTMAAYIGAVRDAGLPPRILLEAWLAGGRLPPDTDLDALEAEMTARAQADADAKAQAAQDAAAMNPPMDPSQRMAA